MWLIFGDIYPVRLLQAIEDEPRPRRPGPFARLARGARRASQLLRHGVLHLHALRVVAAALSLLGASRLVLVYRKDLPQPLTPWKAEVPIEISRAGEADMEEGAAIEYTREDRASHAERFRKRLRDGNHCFVARVDSKIVAYNWICVGSTSA